MIEFKKKTMQIIGKIFENILGTIGLPAGRVLAYENKNGAMEAIVDVFL